MLTVIVPVWFAAEAQNQAVPIVLISIDGLKPDYVLDADKHGLKIPNLRSLAAEGAHASGVTGVLPTVTYPSHTTIVTGVAPAKHGITANSPFDPFSRNMGGWYWYAEDLKVPTLWDACAKGRLVEQRRLAGYGGANITFNIVQYWRAQNAEDRKLIRALSTPGLFNETETALGPYTDGNDYSSAETRGVLLSMFICWKRKTALSPCIFW
jgi:hypothetical protein